MHEADAAAALGFMRLFPVAIVADCQRDVVDIADRVDHETRPIKSVSMLDRIRAGFAACELNVISVLSAYALRGEPFL